MSQNVIVLLIDDLLLAAQLEATLQRAGYTVFFAANEATLSRLLVKAPTLVIVDLKANFNWEKLVRVIKGPGKKNVHLPALGFGPHSNLPLQKKALAAGCAAVVTRAAIAADLPALVKKYTWQVDSAACAETLPPLVKQGIKEFNQELFYRCHETLEDVWKEEQRPIRLLYQGILQISVGYFHIKQGNWRGAAKVIERGIPKAARFRPACQGIDVADLVTQAQAVHAELLELGEARIGEFTGRSFPGILLIEE
ncbi:MAG TPA: DUF309 domain-containing protein [Chloroflexi bacterium]|nr:DUF309 domain-containing protein [Chloroflexota bacterium]